MFILVDCNNFYVSCERLFRPELRNRPVVVLSNNDGCIVARSNEIKEMGIPMGKPLFEVEHILRESHTVIFSSNYALYGDISRRVMNMFTKIFALYRRVFYRRGFLFVPDISIHEYEKFGSCHSYTHMERNRNSCICWYCTNQNNGKNSKSHRQKTTPFLKTHTTSCRCVSSFDPITDTRDLSPNNR